MLAERRVELRKSNPRLDDRHAVAIIDVEDMVHAREIDVQTGASLRRFAGRFRVLQRAGDMQATARLIGPPDKRPDLAEAVWKRHSQRAPRTGCLTRPRQIGEMRRQLGRYLAWKGTRHVWRSLDWQSYPVAPCYCGLLD